MDLNAKDHRERAPCKHSEGREEAENHLDWGMIFPWDLEIAWDCEKIPIKNHSMKRHIGILEWFWVL